jgi:hypothetical protein
MSVESPVKIVVVSLAMAVAGCAGLWGFDPLNSAESSDAGADTSTETGGGAGGGCDGPCTGATDGSGNPGSPCVLDTAAIDRCTLQ